MEYLPVRGMHFSGSVLTFGVVEHLVEGTEIKVYSPAKTVADCFKFRSTIGAELGPQALRDCLCENKAAMDGLWEAAKVCRVTNVTASVRQGLLNLAGDRREGFGLSLTKYAQNACSSVSAGRRVVILAGMF